MVYVYFIQSGGKAIKIGSAKNVDRRLKMLQTGNQFELKIVAKIGFEFEAEARAYEKKLHRFFQSQHIRGEWFHESINLGKVTDPTARFKLQGKHKELKQRRKEKAACS